MSAPRTDRVEREERQTRTNDMQALQKRIAELRVNPNMTASDAFNIPEEWIPPGWKYIWGRLTYNGSVPDTAREMDLLRTGWTPVPPERHPDLVVKNYSGMSMQNPSVILIKGLMLMERPLIFSQEAEQKRERENTLQLTSLKSLQNFMGDEYMPGLNIKSPVTMTQEQGFSKRGVSAQEAYQASLQGQQQF